MTAEASGALAAAARRWADFFESLSPATLDDITRHCRPDVRFKDPFNDITGIDNLRRVFEHMFETLDEPVFKVTDIAVSEQAAYLRWDFFFTPKGQANKSWTITGMSEVRFDDDFRVLSHVDHWDAGEQFYARLPVLGHIIHWVRSKVSSA
ncbi:nuclear transport factor 2 family protein [Hwanghaeella grinnelliae]|uniref:Nuclear transport factor 2 family protein n=1 Tax=Hwanghaeella grinnelliae TaxID=2500179 RepID=A0A3S2Z4L8_9PROT|nr:nuclear transport factor 2 family protein [Hwanghaeella grinnelliae]RVU33688.1 nuclear transport factor 2 family protein [Hwanghaeella grinnelliae]